MAALGPIAGALNGMQSDACTGACRYDLVGLGTGVWMIGPAACLLGATVLLLKRSRSGRPLAWICGVALALQLGVALLGDALISAGVQ